MKQKLLILLAICVFVVGCATPGQLETLESRLDARITSKIAEETRDRNTSIRNAEDRLNKEISSLETKLDRNVENLETQQKEDRADLRERIISNTDFMNRLSRTMIKHEKLLVAIFQADGIDLEETGIYVTDVTPRNVTINRGANAGLTQGVKIDIFSRTDGSKVGEITLTQVKAQESVGEVDVVEDRGIRFGDEGRIIQGE